MTRLCPIIPTTALILSLAAPAIAQDQPQTDPGPLEAAAELDPAAPMPTTHGCRGIETAALIPTIEGQDGIFFRRDLAVKMHFPIAPETAAMVGRLARALDSQGTRLVYVPLPTRGLAMRDGLPELVRDYGFDPDVATRDYQGHIALLRGAGIVTVNALDPLRALPPEGETAFLKTDFHWSSTGALAVAGAVAQTLRDDPRYDGLPHVDHTSASLGRAVQPSEMRAAIQTGCRLTLPAAETEAFATTAKADAASAEAGGIFATEASAPPVVLVGTSMSDTPAFNFAGFLAEKSSLEVTNRAVTGGNQFGAILSYLLSDDFRDAPPPFLVWENPVYNNLGEFGEAPLVEMLAAVAGDCAPLAAQLGDDGRLTAPLPADGVKPRQVLLADSGTATTRRADLAFAQADGTEAEATVLRSARYDPTRRFYQRIEPLWQPGMKAVSAVFDRAPGPEAGLYLCTLPETAP